MAKTAKQILEEAAKQIDAGNWVEGELGTCTRDSNGMKIMGCALGLVSILGGDDHPKSRRFIKIDGEVVEVRKPRYPRDTSPPEVKEAVEALARAIPMNRLKDIGISREYYEGFNSDGTGLPDLVVNYNDGGITKSLKGKERSFRDKRRAAATWFRAAAKLV